MFKIIPIFLLLISLLTTVSSQELSENVLKYVSEQESLLAFTNVIIYDGLGNSPKSGQTLLVANGKISVVGNLNEFIIPKQYKQIDMTGKTIIPGLVMMHEHLFYPTMPGEYYNLSEMLYSFPKLYLAGGATTIRTAGGSEPGSELKLSQFIREGKAVGPEIHVTSQHINRPSEMPIYGFDFINSPEEAGRSVDFWGAKGISSFKLYTHITKADMTEVVNRAHAKNYHVTGHICAVTYREAADIGIDNLEHGFLASSDFNAAKKIDSCDSREARKALVVLNKDDSKMKKLMKHLIDKNVTITSTLPVFEPYTGREIIPGGGLNAVVQPLREKIMLLWSKKQGLDSTQAELFKKEMYWEKQFFDMGGKLTNGTDPTFAGRTVAGYSNQRSLELLVEAGFTTEQAIMISTKNGAEFLGVFDKKGSIEAGKNADFVIIDADLRKDVSNIRKMETVFKDGIGYDSQQLFESVKGQVGLH
ncbi:MAG: amidohydrolase family protein [Reichenbachiella sp.]